MSNEILPFSADVSANVLSQSAYNSDSQRLTGNQPGIARAQLVNKALRQVSVMAAGFGQFIANRQANNVTDNLTPTQVETYLQAALASRIASLPAIISGAATSWWRKSSDGFIEQGVAGIVVPASGGFVSVSFPIAFITTLLDIQVSVYNAAESQVGWSDATLTNLRLETGLTDLTPRVANILVRGY